MRIFVYEFVTGGGMWLAGSDPPAGSLLEEGRAMAQAVAFDFAQIPGVEVLTTRDARLPAFHDGACNVLEIQGNGVEEQVANAVRRLAGQSEWSLLIAPETRGHLQGFCSLVSQCRSRLLSPRFELVRLATNKHETAELLVARGIRCPEGQLVHDAVEVDQDIFPAVVKPNDGCGSLGVQCVANRSELYSALRNRASPAAMRVERMVPGLSASVAVLCGAGKPRPLPACQQRLSGDGRFIYRGGQLPLPESLNHRARHLALSVVRALPDPFGYIGIDLILGAEVYGAGDYVIEVNPRLTTSYVGLRALSRTNLAAAMLAVARGDEPALSWRDGVVEFTASGRVTMTHRTSSLGMDA